MMERKKLTDILRNGAGDNLRQAWSETKAAEEFTTLPAAEYIADLVKTELINGRTNGTPGVKLEFQIAEGDHAGRKFWLDIWLTEAALPLAKRDLAKIGVVSLDQLEQPLPARLRCRVKLVVRRDDDGSEHNRVKWFEVLGIVEPVRDAFAPANESRHGETATVEQAAGNEAEGTDAADTDDGEATDQDSPTDF